jgi:hypothetical protein
MTEHPLTEQESLQIIKRMIESAKQEQKDDGMGWIIWGWLLFGASVLSFINQYTFWVSDFFFWNIFGIASFLLLLFHIYNSVIKKKAHRFRTYTSVLFEQLNIGFFISLVIIILSMNTGNVDPIQGFALLLTLYGFWILIYGATLNFKPSVIGAYFTWVCAVVSLYVVSFNWTMLLHAIAVMGGYIIPGHLANRIFSKSKSGKT